MPMEVHKDNSPFAFGTHKRGNNSASLVDPKADFKSCGVMTGVLIKNTTDGSEGLITSVEEGEIGVTLAGGVNNYWDVDDEYEIYLTATYNSKISSIYVDRSRGWRSDKETLDKGWKLEDVDRDKHEYSDGFPEVYKE